VQYFRQFDANGGTGVILIKELHFSGHTWPEERYATAPIFTHGQKMDSYVTIEVMEEKFGIKEARYQEI